MNNSMQIDVFDMVKDLRQKCFELEKRVSELERRKAEAETQEEKEKEEC